MQDYKQDTIDVIRETMESTSGRSVVKINVTWKKKDVTNSNSDLITVLVPSVKIKMLA